MKAVIPVAGTGTNLRPHTHTQPKPMIPVAGKPILGHIIESLLAVGVKKQVFILGYLGDKIREYVEGNYAHLIEAEFVVQEPRRGLAHAFWIAREELSQEDQLLTILGDTFFAEKDLANILSLPGSALGLQPVNDPWNFGVAIVEDERITGVVERPTIPKSNLAIAGLYRINNVPLLYEILEEMLRFPPTHGRDQYFLSEAITQMIGRGAIFLPYMVENWHDCGRKQSLLHTNRVMLERVPQQQYSYHNSVIIPPVYIANGCVIENSIVGPFVAVGENAQLRNSIVRNSILGAYSHLESIVLRNSVVGNDTSLRGRSNSVNIGDNTEIDFEE